MREHVLDSGPGRRDSSILACSSCRKSPWARSQASAHRGARRSAAGTGRPICRTRTTRSASRERCPSPTRGPPIGPSDVETGADEHGGVHHAASASSTPPRSPRSRRHLEAVRAGTPDPRGPLAPHVHRLLRAVGDHAHPAHLPPAGHRPADQTRARAGAERVRSHRPRRPAAVHLRIAPPPGPPEPRAAPNLTMAGALPASPRVAGKDARRARPVRTASPRRRGEQSEHRPPVVVGPTRERDLDRLDIGQRHRAALPGPSRPGTTNPGSTEIALPAATSAHTSSGLVGAPLVASGSEPR